MTILSTARLLLREMTVDDIDDMATLLGDPVVMRYYPRPKTRAQAGDWIEWNRRLYRERGFGLWIVYTRDTREFVGDCGLTLQRVDGVEELEIGYHVRADLQRQGFATEAASACRDHAREAVVADRLIAIINPANIASQRVAVKLGMAVEKRTTGWGDGEQENLIFAMAL